MTTKALKVCPNVRATAGHRDNVVHRWSIRSGRVASKLSRRLNPALLAVPSGALEDLTALDALFVGHAKAAGTLTVLLAVELSIFSPQSRRATLATPCSVTAGTIRLAARMALALDLDASNARRAAKRLADIPSGELLRAGWAQADERNESTDLAFLPLLGKFTPG